MTGSARPQSSAARAAVDRAPLHPAATLCTPTRRFPSCGAADRFYRVLSNAGFWCIGRLSTDADRERIVEAMTSTGAAAPDAETLASVLKALAPRWFVMRNMHRPKELALLQSRTTLCWLRGPMTRGDLRRLGPFQ